MNTVMNESRINATLPHTATNKQFISIIVDPMAYGNFLKLTDVLQLYCKCVYFRCVSTIYGKCNWIQSYIITQFEFVLSLES